MISHLRIVPMILVMGTIFFLSHQAGDSLKLPAFYGADKIAHFIAYSVLAITIIYAHKNWQTITLRTLCFRVLTVVLLYGLSDEYHQSFIPMRYTSMADVVADCFGGIAVVLVLKVWRKRKGSI